MLASGSGHGGCCWGLRWEVEDSQALEVKTNMAQDGSVGHCAPWGNPECEEFKHENWHHRGLGSPVDKEDLSSGPRVHIKKQNKTKNPACGGMLQSQC